MKRLVFLAAVVGSVFFTSCMKDEVKPVQKTKSFTEPTDPEEIKMKVNTFLAWMEADVSRDASGEVNIDEAVWLIEAGLNSEYDELQYVVGSSIMHQDSILISATPTYGITESDLISVYNFFNQRMTAHANDTLYACRVIDIEYSDSYLKCNSVYSEIDFEADMSRGFNDPFFVSGESYYAYSLNEVDIYNLPPTGVPDPGSSNAAKRIKFKLELRYGIGYFPTGSYFVNVTGWYPGGQWVGPMSDYYGQTCSGYPGNFKMWGSPGIYAVYKGNSESFHYNYTTLNYLLDEAYNRIQSNFVPRGKQVCTINYSVAHAGERLNDPAILPCYPDSYEFFSLFQWQYGTLVTP